jgi:hypothetical protein
VTSAQPVAGAGASASAAPAPIAGNGQSLVVNPKDLPQVTYGDNGKISYPSGEYAKNVSELQSKFTEETPMYEAAARTLAQSNDVKAELATAALESGGMLGGGAGGKFRLALGNLVNTAAQIAGAQPPLSPTALAAGQASVKDTNQLGFNFIKSIFGGQKETNGIVDTGIASVPGIENSPLGGALVADLVSAGAQWKLDQQKYKQQFFEQTKGNLTGADAKFLVSYPPSTYLLPVLKKYGIQPDGAGFASPQDAQKLREAGLISGQMLYDQGLRQGWFSKKVYDAAKANDWEPPGVAK